MVKRNRRRPPTEFTGDGSGVVNHVGARLVAELADEVGLTSALSAAMAPTKQRRRGHDRGEVLVDLAVMLADGGKRISDLATLREQPGLFGEVASHPTVWRTLEAVDADALERIKIARAHARAKAWAAGADPGFYVIDIDATLIGSHSDKEHAAPTYKRGFGFHPLLAYLDGTGEALAGLLRPGNAGSGTATDHVAVLDDALAQLPIDPAGGAEVIVRADSAGWSHKFVKHCRARQVNVVIGHRLTVDIANVLVKVPRRAWSPAISADGSDRRDVFTYAPVTTYSEFQYYAQPAAISEVTHSLKKFVGPPSNLDGQQIDHVLDRMIITGQGYDPDLAEPPFLAEIKHPGYLRREVRVTHCQVVIFKHRCAGEIVESQLCDVAPYTKPRLHASARGKCQQGLRLEKGKGTRLLRITGR